MDMFNDEITRQKMARLANAVNAKRYNKANIIVGKEFVGAGETYKVSLQEPNTSSQAIGDWQQVLAKEDLFVCLGVRFYLVELQSRFYASTGYFDGENNARIPDVPAAYQGKMSITQSEQILLKQLKLVNFLYEDTRLAVRANSTDATFPIFDPKPITLKTDPYILFSGQKDNFITLEYTANSAGFFSGGFGFLVDFVGIIMPSRADQLAIVEAELADMQAEAGGGQ